MNKAIFYHAGCPVCVSAEHAIVNALDRSQFEVEVVHLGKERSKIADAEQHGVKSVPALVLPNHEVLHINFGASLAEVKG